MATVTAITAKTKLLALTLALAVSQAEAGTDLFYGVDEIIGSLENDLKPSSLQGLQYESPLADKPLNKAAERWVPIHLNEWNPHVRPLLREALSHTLIPRVMDVEKPDLRAMKWMSEKTQKLFDVSWKQPNPYQVIRREGLLVEFFQNKSGIHGFNIEERPSLDKPSLYSTLEWNTKNGDLDRFVQKSGKEVLTMTQDSKMLKQRFPSQFSLRLITPAAARPLEDRIGLIGAIEITGRELLPDFSGKSKIYPAYPSGQINRLFKMIIQALQ